MSRLLALPLFLLLAQFSYAATYYVRTDGGTSTQCTGLSDAAYDGSGSAEACAFSHPAWALGGLGTSGVMSSGDTLIITAEQYMVGYGMPNETGTSYSWSYDSGLKAPPAGVSSSEKTKIYGKGYDTGCTGTKAQLWGTEAAYNVLVLNSNVDVQCLEITDHSACMYGGPSDGTIDGFPVKCVEGFRTGVTSGTYARTGVYVNSGSANISMSNVDIHGMAYRGIMAIKVGDMDLSNVRIIGNSFVGWDSDGTDADDSYTGSITLTSSKVEWSGCGERYPLTTTDLSASTDKHHCYSQDQGGFGDGIGLGDGAPGNWTFIDSSVSWNTSDGVDLLHGNGTGIVKFLRSKAEGNAGQAFKSSVATTYIENSHIIGNCGFFYGQSFTSTKDTNGSTVSFNHCRAAGDTIAFSVPVGGTVMRITNSTILSNGNVVIVSGGSGCDANTRLYAYNNIIYGGTEFSDGTDLSDFYYASGAGGNGDGPCGSLAITENYNIIYNTKTVGSDCAGGSSLCDQNPLFTGTIRQGPSTYYTTTDYAAQLYIASGSPARDLAIESVTLTGTSNDYNNYDRGASWDAGALEYGSSSGAVTTTRRATGGGTIAGSIH